MKNVLLIFVILKEKNNNKKTVEGQGQAGGVETVDEILIGYYLYSLRKVIWLIANQDCIQPRKNGAKRLLNGHGDALNTLFW